MKISLLLPTRQRPGQLMRMFGSALHTADDPSRLELVTYIDDDDASYDNVDMSGWDTTWIKVRGPRLHDGKVNLSVKWNECWRKASGEVYMHCGDDLLFRTNGWDSAVVSALASHPGMIAFVWCNDMEPGTDMSHFGTHGFVHRNWTDVVGRFVPPYFVSDFNDTWFNDVAEMAGVRHYLHEHWTEHLHYVWGKAAKDQNTLERLERHERERPDALYHSQKMADERQVEAMRLRLYASAAV